MMKNKNKKYPMIYRPAEIPTVLEATSFRDRMFFYVNPNIYLLGIQNTNGCILKIEEKLSIDIGILITTVIWFILVLTITKITDNMSIAILIILFPYMPIINSIYHRIAGRASKHAAEHMLCNFINVHHRLPKTLKEIKSSSRICADCGTWHFAHILLKHSISMLFGFFIAISTNDKMLFYLVFPPTTLFIFIPCFFVRFKKLDKLVLKISFFLQRHLTTKEAKDSDILLAYALANYWMRIVYPEYCNEEDFNNDLLKNYHVDTKEIEHLL